jgi:hypothetical protein
VLGTSVVCRDIDRDIIVLYYAGLGKPTFPRIVKIAVRQAVLKNQLADCANGHFFKDSID